MLCRLRQCSKPYGMLLAVLMTLALGFYADLAARMAPAGHSMAATADPASGHAHHQGTDNQALMKTCAGYCSIAGMTVEPLPVPMPPGAGASPLPIGAAAPFQPRPASPPPRSA